MLIDFDKKGGWRETQNFKEFVIQWYSNFNSL